MYQIVITREKYFLLIGRGCSATDVVIYYRVTVSGGGADAGQSWSSFRFESNCQPDTKLASHMPHMLLFSVIALCMRAYGRADVCVPKEAYQRRGQQEL